MNNQFVVPGGYKKWSMGLMFVGLLSLLLGFVLLNPLSGSHGDNLNSTRFWAVLLQTAYTGFYW